MCNHLNVHPMKVTPEQVAEVIVEMRDKTFRGEQPPRGLSYYSQREAWRGYFQMIRGVPGQIMSDLGVDAMDSHGSGKHSKQRLTQAQREQFGQGLLELCRNPKNHFNYNHYLEGLAAAKFMYYTGTRRTATCNIDFQNCRFELTPDLRARVNTQYFGRISLVSSGRAHVILEKIDYTLIHMVAYILVLLRARDDRFTTLS